MDMPSSELTISASEFKAKCLDILKRLGEHRLRKVVVTRRGKPVAELTPPAQEGAASATLFGSMKDKIWIDPELDLTMPACEDEWDADKGILYNE